MVEPQIAHVRDRREAAQIANAFSSVLRLTPQCVANSRHRERFAEMLQDEPVRPLEKERLERPLGRPATLRRP